MAFLPPGVDALTAVILIVFSFFTSALTAAFGIGGGMAMLGGLAGTVPPSVVVAVHGVVQLGSNLGRAILQRAHAHWPAVLRFLIGSLIGISIGAWLFVGLPERLLLGLLGVFILIMVWVPKPKIPGMSKAGILLGGVISSVLTMFVGATGSFTQATLMPLGLDRKGLIATHAVIGIMAGDADGFLRVFAGAVRNCSDAQALHPGDLRDKIGTHFATADNTDADRLAGVFARGKVSREPACCDGNRPRFSHGIPGKAYALERVSMPGRERFSGLMSTENPAFGHDDTFVLVVP